ncbi:oligosaccharide repeat unit polymerase [Enterococcus sp. BWR-S5]|uniref:oligosaccharide repeat unit polymerase n=1 Tax=Enterococcus sp. BWR-S5 TaxID=2787714 RepID=UPI001921091C|nr:oligosaccharide repeat unit polymerase [Enterococcus sp. BWR-S5]MBL1223915.1 oligosaccharide repeat unit polymerase [Enterococcus sp. BWR-S5]
MIPINKKIIGLIMLLLVGCSIFIGQSSAQAETLQFAPDSPESLTVGDYHIDSYKSYISGNTKVGFLTDEGRSAGLNAAANIVFDFNKIIYSMFDYGLEIFSDNNILYKYVDQFTVYSKRIYDNLYSKYMTTIIVIVAVYCFYLYTVKSEQQAIRKFLLFVTVFIVGFVWNERAADIIKYVDTLAVELQADLMAVTSENQSNTTNPTVKVRNTLFEMTIEEPFYLLNYGVTSKGDVNTKEQPKRATSLLSAKNTKEEYDAIDNYIKTNEQENDFLSLDKVGWKLSISLISLPMTILIGAPMFLIQMFNFLLQMLTLLISSVIGLSLFISLIPSLSSATKNTFKYLFGLITFRAGTGIVFSLLILIIQLGRTIVPATDSKSYMTQVFTIFFVLFVCWKFKDKIITMVTGGMITSIGGGIGAQVDGTRKKTTEKIRNLFSKKQSKPSFSDDEEDSDEKTDTSTNNSTKRKEEPSVDPNDLQDNNKPYDAPNNADSTGGNLEEQLENARNDIQSDISSLGQETKKGFSDIGDQEEINGEMIEEMHNQFDIPEAPEAYDNQSDYSINQEMAKESQGYSTTEFNEPDINYSEYTTNHENMLNDSYDIDMMNDYGSDLQESQEDRIPKELGQVEQEAYRTQMYEKIVELPIEKDKEAIARYQEELAEARGE